MLLGKSNSFGTLKILIIAIGLFSVTGCKKPESNFRLNKYEYAAGEMLLLENLSINAKGSVAYKATDDGKIVGGVIVVINFGDHDTRWILHLKTYLLR